MEASEGYSEPKPEHCCSKLPKDLLQSTTSEENMLVVLKARDI